MTRKAVWIIVSAAFLAAPSFAASEQPQAPASTAATAATAASAAPASAPSVSPTSAAPDATLAPVETPAFKALFSSEPDPLSSPYVVKPGQTLTAIAKETHSTAAAIQRVSGLKSDRLRPNQKLKVPAGPFSAVVDKSQNTLMLKSGETILKTYRVSTGENNDTPVGVFKVTDKLKDPAWYKEEKSGLAHKIPAGSPKNQLGSRWIGLDKPGYGIHGTIEPEKLGTQCTQGCVRMRNEEVEELYDLLPPGAEVTIVD